MALSNIKLAISVDGVSTATDAFADVNKSLDGLGRNTQTVASVMESSWAKMTAAFAAGNIITKVIDSIIEKFSQLKDAITDAILLSARYETLGVVMKVVGATANYTASQMAGFQAGLQKTGISAVESRQGLALMAQANVDFANSSKLARIAQDAAVIGNINSSEAFNRMMTGIATGQTILLHHLGLMTNFENAYVTAAHAVGKSKDELTEHEKAQIRVNEVMRAGVGIAGSYEAAMGTAGKQLNSMKRYVDDLKVQFGEMFQGALITGVTALSNALKYVSANFEDIKIAAMAVASVMAGAAMYAAAPMMLSLAGAVGTVLIAVNSFAYALVTADGAAIAATFSFNALKVAMATNPLGLIIAALTTAVGLWMTYIKVQSDAIDRNAPKDNPILAGLREEVDLLQRKIDLIKKGKGLETVTDPQVLELKRLEMQKQFISDQDSSSGAGFRITQTEMERAAIEKAIPQVAALRKELEKLQRVPPPVKPDNSWQTEANSLISTYNQLQIETLKSDKAQTDLSRTLDVLSEKEKSVIQTFKDGGTEASKYWASQGINIASITAAYVKLKENAIAADLAKGQDAYNKAVLASGIQDLRQNLKAEESALDASYAARSISGRQYYSLKESLIKKEGESELTELNQNLKKAQDAYKLLPPVGIGTGASLEAAAEVVKAQALIDAATDKTTIALNKNSKSDIEFYNQERTQLLATANEIAAMNAKNSATSASMVGTNATGGFDSIADQTANQMAVLADAHKTELARIEERRQAVMKAALEKGIVETDAVQKVIALSEVERLAKEKNQKAVAKIGLDSYHSQLSAASTYTGMAGQLFGALATTQDQSSRSGFESAKAFNIAAAIMSTAAAVMNAFATMPWPMAPIAAGLAAATGAIQIATIAATTFGGGAAAPAAPSGSFASGGASGGSAVSVGASIGAPITSVQDQQTSHQLQVIADKIGNAALAMGKSADSLYVIADAFKIGSGSNVVAGAPNKFTSISDATNPVKYASNMFAGQSGLAAALVAPFTMATGLLVSLGQSMFGHGAWTQTGAGIQMQMAGGKLAAQQYVDSTSKGGWFTSDRHSTTISAADELFVKNINAELGKMQESIKVSAVAMGINGDVMDTAINTATLDLGRIATAGRTNEQIATDIGAAFNRMSNQIITQAIPNIANYAINSAETANDTYSRLSASLMDVTAQFTLVGKAVTMTGIDGANAAYQLQQLFGGADKMATAMDNYFTAMYTDTEQSALKASYASTQVTAAFMKMGLEVPKTNAEFNALRNSVTDPALFAALTALGPTFAEITKQATEASATVNAFNSDLISRGLKTNGQTSLADLYDLKVKQENEMIDATKNGMDTQWLAIVQQGEYAAAMKKASETVDAAIQKIIDTSKTALTDSLSSVQSILNTKKSLLTSASGMLSPELAYSQAKTQFDNSTAATISTNVTAFLEASKNFAPSLESYQSDYRSALNKLDQFSGTTGDLSAVETQLTLLSAISKAVGTSDGVLVSKLSTTWNALQIVTGNATGPLAIEYNKLTQLISGIDPNTGSMYVLTDTAAQAVNTAITAVKGAMAGTIDTASATATITAAYGTVSTELGNGMKPVGDTLSTVLDSFVTKLGLYVKAMNDATTQAGVNQTNLTNQNVALDVFTKASTAYQTASSGLVNQYRLGTLTADDYNKQNDAAYAPVNSAYTAATNLGITSLPATIEVQLTPADTAANLMKKYLDDKAILDGYIARGVQAVKSNPGGVSPYIMLSQTDLVAADLDSYRSAATSAGLLPAFAKGGITNQPSIFGEAGWEAAVPLPDGRSIPVKFSDNYRLDVSELVSELKALREEVKELRNEQRAGQVAIADNTGKTARQLSRWDGDGMPAVRDAV